MRTGQVLDFYDDPTGMVLRDKVAYTNLPDFIKTAQKMDEDTRDKLPDDVFALIMVDQGRPFRKYACQDKGNTALSVIYFMENHHKLPEEAQKVAAANLLRACDWYDLQPPAQLYKLAAAKKIKAGELVGSEIMPKSGPEKQAAGDEGNPDQSTQNPGKEEPQKLAFAPAVAAALPAIGKVLSVGSTILGAGSALKNTVSKVPKLASAMRPYVDVTGKSAPARMVEPQIERHGLVKEGSAKFPLDSYGQVKQASAWFDDYHQSLHPADRHEFATKLASRANELDIKVSDLIKKYGSIDYAPSGEVNVAIHCRMQHWAEDAPERDMLKGLMDKYASVRPDIFCEALRQFDEMTGLDHKWDETVHDPWYSTYGFDKQAEGWAFSYAGDRITSEQLRSFAAGEKYCKLKKIFGDEVAEELKKHPEKIFDSLPLDSKRIIMRMAADPQP